MYAVFGTIIATIVTSFLIYLVGIMGIATVANFLKLYLKLVI